MKIFKNKCMYGSSFFKVITDFRSSFKVIFNLLLGLPRIIGHLDFLPPFQMYGKLHHKMLNRVGRLCKF